MENWSRGSYWRLQLAGMRACLLSPRDVSFSKILTIVARPLIFTRQSHIALHSNVTPFGQDPFSNRSASQRRRSSFYLSQPRIHLITLRDVPVEQIPANRSVTPASLI